MMGVKVYKCRIIIQNWALFSSNVDRKDNTKMFTSESNEVMFCVLILILDMFKLNISSVQVLFEGFFHRLLARMLL